MRKLPLTRSRIVSYLESSDLCVRSELMTWSSEVRLKEVGNKSYFRGLIELSNICEKNCFYCGIRRENRAIERYEMGDEQVVAAARYAHEQGYGSIVLQGGERRGHSFRDWIGLLLDKINAVTGGGLGITLSFGEQTEETYRAWFEHGATRYLLRFEASSPELYAKLHPQDGSHRYVDRIDALKRLRAIGYQVGSGFMVGLPWQTYEDIADDLLLIQSLDCDMVGLGPYIEHRETPLDQFRGELRPKAERLELTLRATALLRIMMRDINIAAATSCQAIHPEGREMALVAGANVIMPNLTATTYRPHYALYDGKPCVDEDAEQCRGCLLRRIQGIGQEVGLFERGDALHFNRRR